MPARPPRGQVSFFWSLSQLSGAQQLKLLGNPRPRSISQESYHSLSVMSCKRMENGMQECGRDKGSPYRLTSLGPLSDGGLELDYQAAADGRGVFLQRGDAGRVFLAAARRFHARN